MIAAMRPAIAAIAAILVIGQATSARAADEYVYTAADTLAAINETAATSGVSWRYLYAIVRCETGGTFDPYAVGRAGEQGAVQLHPRGELKRFYAYGYDNPWSPYQAVDFLAQRINAGGARAWSCA